MLLLLLLLLLLLPVLGDVPSFALPRRQHPNAEFCCSHLQVIGPGTSGAFASDRVSDAVCRKENKIAMTAGPVLPRVDVCACLWLCGILCVCVPVRTLLGRSLSLARSLRGSPQKGRRGGGGRVWPGWGFMGR